MVYTVRQLSNLAGVSARTLHYYDEIGLLNPSSVGDNGYRYYDERCVFRLQQVQFFKELGLALDDIREIMDRPDFDVIQALKTHREELKNRAARLENLVHTVDKTILHLEGAHKMGDKELFEGFSEEKQKEYAEEIRRKYGKNATEESDKNWNSYSPEKKRSIIAEGNIIHSDLAATMEKGYASPETQQVIARWHQHLRYFYEPSIERLRGLGEMYVEHPDFKSLYEGIRPGLAEYFKNAIREYCDRLEK